MSFKTVFLKLVLGDPQTVSRPVVENMDCLTGREQKLDRVGRNTALKIRAGWPSQWWDVVLDSYPYMGVSNCIYIESYFYKENNQGVGLMIIK